LLLAGIALCNGCVRERTITGRWKSGSSNFYFREDGVVYYRASSGSKFRGRYRFDTSAEPNVMEARMREINGGSRSLTLKLDVKFLTADRIRVDSAEGEGRSSRVSIFSRVSEAEFQASRG
jgi:hypothetical protein